MTRPTGSQARAQEMRELLRRSQPRRGLRLLNAAAYIGVNAEKFLQLVKQKRMPPPKRIDGVNVWDIAELDDAFEGFPTLDAGSTEPPEPLKPWSGYRR